jgi:ureidoglycolate hydrolase
MTTVHCTIMLISDPEYQHEFTEYTVEGRGTRLNFTASFVGAKEQAITYAKNQWGRRSVTIIDENTFEILM